MDSDTGFTATFGGLTFKLIVPDVIHKHSDLIGRVHQKINTLHPLEYPNDENITSKLQEILDDKDLLEYQEKFGSMVGEYPKALRAPKCFGDIIFPLTTFIEPEDAVLFIDTLSESTFFMSCLNVMEEDDRGAIMTSLYDLQERIPTEHRIKFFEACAKGNFLSTIINDNDPIMEDRSALITFLASSFNGADEGTIIETLEKTGALDCIEWDDEIEEWTRGWETPLTQALLHTCNDSRNIYLAEMITSSEDKPDTPHT